LNTAVALFSTPLNEPLARLGDQDILSGRSKLPGGVLPPAYPWVR